MTRYLDRLFAGEEPSVNEWNEHLVVFHRSIDQIMLASSLFRTRDGETTYEHMARRVHDAVPTATAILDVGCGDGMLLEEISRRYGSDLALHGIDLSEREIERARERLPATTFTIGDAAATDFQALAFDVALAHLTFRVFADLRAALARLRLALRRDGKLMFLIEDPSKSPSMGMVIGSAVATVKRNHPRFAFNVPKAIALLDDQEIHAVVREAGFSGAVDIEGLEVSAEVTIEQACAIVQRTYFFGLLAPPLLAEMNAAVAQVIAQHHGPNGLITLTMPMKLVRASVN